MMKKLHPHLLMTLFLTAMMMSVAKAEQVTFQNAENIISGHYLLPDNGKPKAIILFVHGDGPLNYDAHGYYPLIWRRLLEQGFAIFSWDKPGIGKSTGNWLMQSMQQRQQEVQSAINFIQTDYGYSGARIGLLGFSQAGWVVPAIANSNPNVGFIIGIGFAINWLEQSWYLTHMRLLEQGASAREIDTARVLHIEEITFLGQMPSYGAYLKKYGHKDDVMTEARYQFVLKNFRVDATADYIKLSQSLLLLLGDKDLNVDILNTKSVVEKVTDDQRRIQVSIIKDATHGMLDAKHFNEQKPGLLFLLKLIWKGEKAVAPDFYKVLDQWLELRK